MPKPETVVIESCHTTWVFEPARQRFRRVPRGSVMEAPVPETDWTEYFGLEIDPDSDAFVVSLNEAGTRLLRSYQHHDPCPQCGVQATGEVSLEAVRDQRR